MNDNATKFIDKPAEAVRNNKLAEATPEERRTALKRFIEKMKPWEPINIPEDQMGEFLEHTKRK